jgi:sialate O-acetylesterase
MLLIRVVIEQSVLLILLSPVLISVTQPDLRFVVFIFISIQGFICFPSKVCCLEANCTNDALWVASPISGKNGLTITITVNSTCVGKPLYGLRYLWRETPCPFKQAALYSSTDANLPSPPYIKLF